MKRPDSHKPPFYGRGLAFPLRIDPSTGGFAVTEGNIDAGGVGFEFTPDGYSVREPIPDRTNHVAESVSHILLTRPGEHDTLPEFGSRLFTLINNPNNWQTQQEFETWVEVATEQWEKRCRIPVPEGVTWKTTSRDIDENIASVRINLEFILTQIAGNLVAPFVTPRQARAEHYPLGEPDEAGHDWASRYRGMPIYRDGDMRYLRHRRHKPILPAPDDIWYQVQVGDTWLLISYRIYGDIRFWWIITDTQLTDAAEREETRDALDNTGDPEPGTLLRMPSRTRVLMELAA